MNTDRINIVRTAGMLIDRFHHFQVDNECLKGADKGRLTAGHLLVGRDKKDEYIRELRKEVAAEIRSNRARRRTRKEAE